MSRTVELTETESRMVVAKGWGVRRNEELLFIGYRVSVLQDEKSTGNGWGWWLHNDVNVYVHHWHSQNCALKNHLKSTFHYNKERLKVLRHLQNSISSFFFSLLPCLQLFLWMAKFWRILLIFVCYNDSFWELTSSSFLISSPLHPCAKERALTHTTVHLT